MAVLEPFARPRGAPKQELLSLQRRFPTHFLNRFYDFKRFFDGLLAPKMVEMGALGLAGRAHESDKNGGEVGNPNMNEKETNMEPETTNKNVPQPH